MAGQEQEFPGGACTDETVGQCESGCITTDITYDLLTQVEETRMEGSADFRMSMCSMGANDNLCDTLEFNLGASDEEMAISNFKCKVTTCDSELCNDPSKSGGDSGKGGENQGFVSSFAVHSVSFVLFSAVFGLLS